MLGWMAPFKIIKSHSWPYTGHPKNPTICDSCMAKIFPARSTGKYKSCWFSSLCICSIKRNSVNRSLNGIKRRSREWLAVLCRNSIAETMGRETNRREGNYLSSKEEKRDQQTGRRATCNDRRARKLLMEKLEQRRKRDGTFCDLM